MSDAARAATAILPLELWQSIAAATLMCHGYKQAFGMLNMCALLRQRTVHSAAFWRTFVFERHYYGRPMYVPLHVLAYCGRHHKRTDSDVSASPLRLFGSALQVTDAAVRTANVPSSSWSAALMFSSVTGPALAQLRDSPELQAYEALRRCLGVDDSYAAHYPGGAITPVAYNMRTADLFVKGKNTAAALGQDEAIAPLAAARFERIEFTQHTEHALFRGWPRVALLTLFCSDVIAAPMDVPTCMALLDALELRNRSDQLRLLWALNRHLFERTPTWLGFALLACASASLIDALDDSRSVLDTLGAAARAIPVIAATARRQAGVPYSSIDGTVHESAAAAAAADADAATEQAAAQARSAMRQMRVMIAYIVYQFARTRLRRSVAPLRVLFNALATHDPTDLPAFLRYVRPFFTAVQRRALVRTVLQARMPLPGDKGHLLRQLLGECRYPLRDIDTALQTELLCSRLPGLGASLVPLFVRHITSDAQLDALRKAIADVHRTTTTELQNARAQHEHISLVFSHLRSARVADLEQQPSAAAAAAAGRGAVRASRGRGGAKRSIAASSSTDNTANVERAAAAAVDDDDVPLSRRFSDSTPAAKRGRRGGMASSSSSSSASTRRHRGSSSEEDSGSDGSSGSESDGSSDVEDMDL